MEPFIVLNAYFGGVQSRKDAAWVRPADPEPESSPLCLRFVDRLRSMGFTKFFLYARVQKTPWMSDGEFERTIEAAGSLIRKSGLPGAVESFTKPGFDEELLVRQSKLFLDRLSCGIDDPILHLDLRASLLSQAELTKLAESVPRDRLAQMTYTGAMPWEFAMATRLRVEKEHRSLGRFPDYVGLDIPCKPPSLPPSIPFEPTLAYLPVLEEALAAAGPSDMSEILHAIWQKKPSLFRGHFGHIGIELTSEDNLPNRARSLSKIAPNRPQGRMTRADWEALLGSLRSDLIPLSMDLWDSGEPLLHPDAIAWIGEAAARGVRVDLRTNGLMLDEAAAERLAASGVEAVYVRLDAATPETYGRVSGDAALFAKAEAGLARLVAAKKKHGLDAQGRMRPIVAVEITEMKETAPDVDAFFQKHDRRAAIEKDLQSKIGRVPSETDILTALYQTDTPIEYAIYRHDNLYRGRIARAEMETYEPLHRFPCRQLHEGPFVMWNGTVLPCREDLEGQEAWGHVRDGVAKIWQDRASGSFFAYHDAMDWRREHFCASCREWYYPFS